MVYRKFRVAVSLRLALLVVWIGLFFYVLIRTELTAGAVLLGLLIVAQVWGIFRTIDRTNRDLARLSKPNLKLFPAAGLFADVAQLLQARFAEGGDPAQRLG